MTPVEELAAKFSGISGGLDAQRGAVLAWGFDHQGKQAVLISQEPTEYELTLVPQWVRREVENNG